MLRIDNADKRLTKYGYELGLISKKDFEAYEEKQARMIPRSSISGEEENFLEDKEKISLEDYLKKPEIRLKNVLEYEKIR